jgi:hypothetical protein
VELAQDALGRVGGAGGVAGVELQLAQPHQAGGSRLLEQAAGFVRASLARPQLAQAHQAAGCHAGTRGLKVLHGRGQLALGRRPVTAGREHAAVGAAADPHHLPAAPALGEAAHGVAPLRRPREIAHPVTGEYQAAEGPGGGGRGVKVLPGRDGRSLIEAAHALLDISAENESAALESQPERLEVGDGEASPELGGVGGQGKHQLGVASTFRAKSHSISASHPWSGPSGTSAKRRRARLSQP